jgi:hypothetical protein
MAHHASSMHVLNADRSQSGGSDLRSFIADQVRTCRCCFEQVIQWGLFHARKTWKINLICITDVNSPYRHAYA